MTADQIFHSHLQPILTSENFYGAALRFARSPDRAEDLVQACALRAWRHREKFAETFTESSRPQAWLFTILRNTFINGFHSASSRARKLAALEEEASCGTLSMLASIDYPSEERLDEIREGSRVVALIDELPDCYREVVRLREIDGLSYPEIAERLSMPIGSVMSKLHRGRTRLASRLGEAA
jgi:RNA polymerase sigma-70 factor (ECF subfamily)